MTPAATPEALEQALAQTMWEQSYATLQDASWAVALRIAKDIPDGQTAHCLMTVRSKAAEVVAQHFTPALATATAEAASLRAEVEAKDRALKRIGNPDNRAEFMLMTSVEMREHARATLRECTARAATAGEGRSDG